MDLYGQSEAMLVLLVLSGAPLACGPDRATVDDDDAELHPNQPLPPIDLDAWCDDSEALTAFAERGLVTRLEQQGPCGHLVTWYYDGESRLWTLWHPDGSVEELGQGPIIESDIFSPTGRLLAWREGDDDPIQRVVTRDLQTGVARTIETQGSAVIGFVRLPESERGARLWVCHAGTLELVDVEPEHDRTLAEDVRCETVSGGELSTRLVYADVDEVLNVVDAKDGTRWATVAGGVNATRISPDGRLGFADGPEPEPFTRVVDLDRGEVVASGEFIRFEQALLADAPVFMLADGELSTWRDDALVPVLDGVLSWTLTTGGDGSATFRRTLAGQEERWFAPADDPSDARLIVSVPDSVLAFFHRSPDGRHGRLEIETEACADADCSETITEVVPWTPAGLGAPMLIAGDWRQFHVFDDGYALGYGAVIEGGSISPEALVLSDPDGVPTATWTVLGVPTVYARPLDDGRVLVRRLYGNQDYWLIFERENPELEILLGPVEIDVDRFDPRLGLLAQIVEVDGPNLLYWGAVPD